MTPARCADELASTGRGNRLSILRGSPALGKEYATQIQSVPKNAGFLHCFGSLGARRHGTRPLQRRRRFGFQIEFGPRTFVFVSHGNPLGHDSPNYASRSGIVCPVFDTGTSGEPTRWKSGSSVIFLIEHDVSEKPGFRITF